MDVAREVTVADDAVAVERVAVSRVLEEELETVGESDCCWLRPVWTEDEVVKERGSVEERLRSARDARLDGPRVCEVRPGICWSVVLAGIASLDDGGSPRYGSAYTIYPSIVCGDEEIATSAASADSKVTLIQFSPPANRRALAFSSKVRGRVRKVFGSRRSDLKRRCSGGGSRG